MADTFQVYFKTSTLAPDAAPGAALRSLKRYGLTVTRHKDYLTASRPDSPAFDIGVSAEPRVREESAEIGSGHAPRRRHAGLRRTLRGQLREPR
jgi:hypothetical protein